MLNVESNDLHTYTETMKETICVDLDYTLVYTDTLLELWLKMLYHQPSSALKAVYLLFFKGMIACKWFLNQFDFTEASSLPYNHELIEWLKDKKKTHHIWLVTGSSQTIAHQVAKHLMLFDGVIASHSKSTMVGPFKAQQMTDQFQTFSYIGDSKKDLYVWPKCKKKGVVFQGKNPYPSIDFDYYFKRPSLTWSAWIQFLSFTTCWPCMFPLVSTIVYPEWASTLLIYCVALTLTHFSCQLFENIYYLQVNRKRKHQNIVASSTYSVELVITHFFIFSLTAFSLSFFISALTSMMILLVHILYGFINICLKKSRFCHVKLALVLGINLFSSILICQF